MKRPFQVTMLGWLFIAVGILKYYLSPFAKSIRSRDRPYLARRNDRYRSRRPLAQERKMGSLVGSSLACLSCCRERNKLTVGCFATRRASVGRRLFPARAADFRVFSECATRMMRFRGITCQRVPNS
jgi:hypothetical protein